MTDQSHAVGGSKVPAAAQEKLPQSVEENVPNTVHDTGSTGSVRISRSFSFPFRDVAGFLIHVLEANETSELQKHVAPPQTHFMKALLTPMSP